MRPRGALNNCKNTPLLEAASQAAAPAVAVARHAVDVAAVAPDDAAALDAMAPVYGFSIAPAQRVGLAHGLGTPRRRHAKRPGRLVLHRLRLQRIAVVHCKGPQAQKLLPLPCSACSF